MNMTTSGGARCSGIYIVMLYNEEPISVNAHDKRTAGRAIKVRRGNCKIGKTIDLRTRQKNYERTFGAENVRFESLLYTDLAADVERRLLRMLDRYRIRGATNRKNEWLEGIDPEEVKRMAREFCDANRETVA